MPTVETLYLQLYDEIKAREALEIRVQSIEHFVREKFPGDFAGDVGTVIDPELNPVLLNTGAPVDMLTYKEEIENGLSR